MQRKERIRASLNVPLILQKNARYAGIISAIVLSSCRGLPPKIDLQLWAGDSSATFDRYYRGDLETSYQGGITRAQSGESIACDDVRIDEYVCMTYADLKKVMDAIWSCQKWPAQVAKMNNVEVNKAYKLYNEVSLKTKESQRGKY